MSIYIAPGDILDLKEGELLVHLWDISRKPNKFSRKIFKKFPFAEVYDNNIPGTITCHNQKGYPIIINLYISCNDIKWYRSGLAQIRTIFPGRDINMEYNIKNWKQYIGTLDEYTLLSTNNVFVYNY